MTEIEEAVAGFLLSDGPLVALIGQRLYPDKVPPAVVFPHVTMQTIAEDNLMSNDGPNALTKTRIQFDIWSKTRLACKQIGRRIKKAGSGVQGRFEGFRGTMGDLTIRGCFHKASVSSDLAPIHADSVGLFRWTLDFEIHWLDEAA